jgi:hypothetical protein
VTALCLRALLCGNGNGVAIERGIAALEALQKPEGIWPGMPVRRMPVDPFISAFVLLLLGDRIIFRKAIRFDDAVEWFKMNELALDEQTARLWSHARRRVPTIPVRVAMNASQIFEHKAMTHHPRQNQIGLPLFAQHG